LLKNGPKEQALWVKFEALKLNKRYNNKDKLAKEPSNQNILMIMERKRESIGALVALKI